MVGTAIAALGLAGCATAISPERSDVVLIKAHIESLADAGNQASANSPEVDLGRATEAAISVREVLIGHVERRAMSVTLHMTAWPVPNGPRDIYLLARTRDGGALETVGWDYANRGLCIDGQTAHALSIEPEVASLRESGRLTCP